MGIVGSRSTEVKRLYTKKQLSNANGHNPACLAANNPGDPHSHAIIACPRFGFLRTRYCERLVNSCGLQGRAHKRLCCLDYELYNEDTAVYKEPELAAADHKARAGGDVRIRASNQGNWIDSGMYARLGEIVAKR